jgi:hypothetical protein
MKPEDNSVPPQERPVQDRRRVSRIQVHLDCQFTIQGIEYEAFIRDISLKGASLLSTFMPPYGANLSITIKTALLEDPLILEGNIVRCDYKHIERGTARPFVISFSHSSLALVTLIKKLANPPKS